MEMTPDGEMLGFRMIKSGTPPPVLEEKKSDASSHTSDAAEHATLCDFMADPITAALYFRHMVAPAAGQVVGDGNEKVLCKVKPKRQKAECRR